MRITLAGIVLAATVFSPLDGIQPSIRVTGGISPNGLAQPLLFTWNTPVPVSGGGWAPGEAVRLILHGPLNSPGLAPRRLPRVSPRLSRGPGGIQPIGPPTATFGDWTLGTFTADAQGNLNAAPKIPYDNGIVGPQARIPRPGYYMVIAFGSASGTTAAADGISLCPDTYKPSTDWGVDRGGRDGVFAEPLRQFSPERFDPEWPTVWDERPVEVYGTIAPTDGNGSDQPARISPSDNPPTHNAHDAILFLLPDAAYRWIVGTANYYDGDPDSPGRGTLEIEWETQNNGSTATYGQGRIGLPVWANPTIGDRVYAVGRWILDAGHPELGDRTEMHPPRLLATMRARPAVSGGATAAQVDVYVSGNGGGAYTMAPGLSTVLDQNGYGGGRIRDALQPAEQTTYYRPGPLASFLYPLVIELVRQVTGTSVSATVYPNAGPSAFPWGTPGAQTRPVNDRDYDFDVPLPPPPSGAAGVQMEAVTHPEHNTGVVESITYNGSTAHVHLPYRGADSGIYARTLKFSWITAPAPVTHLVAHLNRIDVTDLAGKWQMWADVSGQWSYLTGAAPGLLNTAAGQGVSLPGTPVDVYLNAGQTLRVYVHGYQAACLDDYFGKLFGQTSYQAGLTFVAACGATDNQDLGGAVIELPAASAKGAHTVAATDAAGAHHFSLTFTVD
jgi:hypothetical protein